MLVLTRKVQQGLKLGEDVAVTVLAIKGTRVRLGVTAPEGVLVLRSELQLTQRGASDGTAKTQATKRTARSHKAA